MSARFAALLSLALLGLSGCAWFSSSVEGPQEERARMILLTALDAWKAGQTDTLATSSPPIRFQDDDQMAGWQLTKYDLVEPIPVIVPFQDVNVLLYLRDLQGKEVRKTAAYQIGLDPITVQRSDN